MMPCEEASSAVAQGRSARPRRPCQSFATARANNKCEHGNSVGTPNPGYEAWWISVHARSNTRRIFRANHQVLETIHSQRALQDSREV